MQAHLNKLNPNEIQFLRPFDELMKVYCHNDKVYFCQLVQKKKQIIQHLMSIGVQPEIYFALVTKVFKSQNVQKEFARMDLILLRDKHKMNKQTWFEELVGETQMTLTQQQAKYNEYQSQLQQQQKPQVQQPVQNQVPNTNSLNINITQFTNLKLLDEFMSKYYETAYKQTFIDLYEKKQRILEALDSGKLKNDQYLMIAKKIFNETKNDEVRKVVKNDLEMLADLHDNNLGEWVKDAVKEAKDEVPHQKETYQMHMKGVEVKKREKKAEIDLDAYMHIPIPQGTDPSQCISFALIDRYMKQSKSNPQLYMTLYQKKQKLLNQLDDGKLTEKIYQEMLKRMMNSVTHEDLKQIYQSDLNDIQDVHEGNVKQWFENVVEETRVSLMIQEDIYAVMKKEFKPVEQPKKVEEKPQQIKKPESKYEPKKEEPKITKKQPTKTTNIDPVLGYNLDQMYSLKVLEDSIIAHEKNIPVFMRLFAQKKKIIDMMSNNELTAVKYQQLQAKLMAELYNNEQVKEQIEFDLSALEDFHDGDVEAWFMEIVETAGMSYEGQLEKYEKCLNEKKYKQISPTNESVQKSKSEKKPPQQQQQQIPTPFNIDKMYSLKVIDNALTQHQKNERLYIKLFAQKQKIIKKMQNNQIDAEKYKALQQKMMEVFADNEDIKDMVEFDLAEIDDMHDGDAAKWFEEVVNSSGVGFENQLENYMRLEEKYGLKQEKVKPSTGHTSTASIHSNQHYESPEKQLESKLSEASNQINHSTPRSKIRFYLHEMAVWESLAKYYEKNGLDPNSNKLLKIYFNVARQEVEDIIEKIKKEPEFDIVSYCKKLFPPITEAVFYQGTQNLEERIGHGIKACNKEIQQLKDYAKILRKGLNVKNFEKVKQKISECQQNIKYLTNLPALVKKNNKLIPLPLVEDLPVNYPNMDEYTHLEANEVELKVTRIEGLSEEQSIKIYFNGTCRHESKVKNGDHNIVIKGQENAQTFAKVLRGDHKSFSISMYTEGWFRKTKNGQQNLEMLFIRTNIHQGKVKVGNATIFYEGRVRMAKSPMMIEIKQIKIIKFPAYEHSKKVEDDLIAKYTTTSKA